MKPSCLTKMGIILRLSAMIPKSSTILETSMMPNAHLAMLGICFMALSSCAFSHSSAFSAPPVHKSREYRLDDGVYRVGFTNAGALTYATTTDSGRVELGVIDDAAVTKISVERTSPSTLTALDVGRAYEIASRYCTSLLRTPKPPEERAKGILYTQNGVWVFQDACR